jgi:uncharacterized membrane protein
VVCIGIAASGINSTRNISDLQVEVARVEHSVEIELPLDDVFGFVSNPINDPYWETALLSGQDLGSPKGVEPKTTRVRKLLGPRFESTTQITDFEPNRRIGVRGTSGPLPFEGTWTFEPVGDRTRVTFSGEIKASGLSKIAEPVFARMLKKDAEANLGSLKDVLEEW